MMYPVRETVSLGYPNTDIRVKNRMGSRVYFTKFKVFG